jgi:hypothetical protein
MQTDPVPDRVVRSSILGAWWFRLVLRAAIALLAFQLLSIADHRRYPWLGSGPPHGQLDTSVWLAWLGWTVGAGIVFGLATGLPLFVKLRYLPSCLLLAVFASVPVIHLWWVFIRTDRPSTAWIGQRWFDGYQIQFVCAALAGVAIASGIREERPGRACIASSDDDRPIVGAWWWLHVLARTAIALLAFLLLSLGEARLMAWLQSSSNGRLDNSLWYAWLGWTVGAGVLFGSATWLPFTKLRYLPSRLLLALLASLPVVHYWWAFLFRVRSSAGLILQVRWFDAFQIQFVCAALAGVAIASGFRSARRGREPAGSTDGRDEERRAGV